jgi:hypothetical protein
MRKFNNTIMSLDYVRDYYEVPAYLGRDVIIDSRLGTITKDMGNYIGVTFHDDLKRKSLPYHPTNGVIYLDSETDLLTLRAKNQRSRDRYDAYLSSETCLSFAEYLGIKISKHRF